MNLHLGIDIGARHRRRSCRRRHPRDLGIASGMEAGRRLNARLEACAVAQLAVSASYERATISLTNTTP
jgi:hypothetical protein